MKKLPPSFYTRKTTTVAKELLGKHIVRITGRKVLSGKIVETEAYLTGDPASHSFRGKTGRTSVMFEKGGLLYVYFTYGMHYCANVVTNKAGYGEAVLIRAIEPIEGIETMIKNRNFAIDQHHAKNNKYKNLTNGPAKLAQALLLTTKDTGTDLTGHSIFITEGEPIPRRNIVITTRIGISKATELPLRYYVKNNAWISKK